MALSASDRHAGAARATPARATGRGTRAAIAAQVGVTLVLALVATLLVQWIAERPGLRLRIDFTRQDENTLAPATLEVLARLPADVRADVFFKGSELDGPLAAVGREAQEHALKVLRLVQDAAGGRVTTEEFDLSDRTSPDTRALARLRELDLRAVDPGGVVVLSAGGRKQVLRLRGDLADIDPGVQGDALQPPQAARVISFRAEEALVSALHKVAAEERPRVVFLRGHGELDSEATGTGGTASLARALEADGFQVGRWSIEEQGALPAEAEVLAILGPGQPFTETEVREILAFVDAGGRLVVAPDFRTDLDGAGSLNAVLEHFGLRGVMSGLLARRLADGGGPNDLRASQILVTSDGMTPQNPVVEPLRRTDRRVYLPAARALERTETTPPGAQVLAFLRADEVWIDRGSLADPTSHDWLQGPGEKLGSFPVGLQVVLPARKPVPPERAPAGARPEARVLCVGSAAAFSNDVFDFDRDLLLNAFNWAGGREYRVAVAIRSPQTRRIELGLGRPMTVVQLVCVWVLPGLCLLLGLATAWRRRS